MDEFIDHNKLLIDYWDKITPDKLDAMNGLVFSILNFLDQNYKVIPLEGPPDNNIAGTLHEKFSSKV